MTVTIKQRIEDRATVLAARALSGEDLDPRDLWILNGADVTPEQAGSLVRCKVWISDNQIAAQRDKATREILQDALETAGYLLDEIGKKENNAT